MKQSGLSRRQLLVRSLWVGGAVAAGLHLPRPRALAAAAASDTPAVFSAQEWATVEAITARLIPTDHEPGAVEAGCVNFIDKALANEDAGLRSLYTAGLRAVDLVARAEGGSAFAKLAPDAQDAVLRALEDGAASAWPAGEPTSQDFFGQIWQHTLWGFLAEPSYGGNRDYAGWRVLGYPGGRHKLGGYSPQQMAGTARVESVWGERLPRRSGESPADG
jgi:gluconate 2-dehydrogenase gamma chain